MAKVSQADRDAIIRTVMGEAQYEPPEGQAAVAHVIMNRVATGRWGDTPTSVVKAKGQFEPWMRRKKELEGYDPKSKEYRQVAAVVDDVLSGKVPDPTGGTTHFLEENIVRNRRGGSLPDWASGQGQRIGNHTFYLPAEMMAYAPQGGGRSASMPAQTARIGAGVLDELERGLKAPPKATPAETVEARFPGQPMGAGILDQLEKDLAGQGGSKTKAQEPPSIPAFDKNEPMGVTVNRWIAENQGDTLKEEAVRKGASFLRGIGDLSNTVGQGATWLGEKAAGAVGYGNDAKAWRDKWMAARDAENAVFDQIAGAGDQIARVGGNIAGSFVPGAGWLGGVAAGGARLAAAAPRLAAILRMITGSAVRGGAGGLLSSSANKYVDPLTQMTTGALFGSLGAGAGKAGGAVLSRLTSHQKHFSPLDAVLLGGGMMGAYHYTPDDLQTELAKWGGLAALIAAAKVGGKAGPRATGAFGTAASGYLSPRSQQE